MCANSNFGSVAIFGSIKCSLETAKIGILAAMKSVIYFRFVSETIVVEPIVLTSRTKKIL